MIGSIHLVGAGPGDPELLTVRAVRRLAEADVVLYDQLVPDAILALVGPRTRRIHVGKVGGGPSTPQSEIEATMVREALAGHRVVRLKGGDPFVFGRGGEEALAAAAHGIPVEVVPGLTSAVAGPAAAGIPVTHRGLATHFTVVTGHGASSDDGLRERWGHLARAGGTIVFLMGVRAIGSIVPALLEAGLSASTPLALVERATRPDQRVTVTTLGEAIEAVSQLRPASPSLFVVGDVVRLHHAIESARATAPAAPHWSVPVAS
jgi:uroporphyrin-III C-methyltransferase